MPLLFAVGMLLSAASALTCGDCKTMQEVIHRSIVHNISALETAALAGTKLTATVEIGQIIWHVCGSDAWKGLRYREPLAKACSEAVKQHVDRIKRNTKRWTTNPPNQVRKQGNVHPSAAHRQRHAKSVRNIGKRSQHRRQIRL